MLPIIVYNYLGYSSETGRRKGCNIYIYYERHILEGDNDERA
jgi:hypothetical protein